MIYLLAMFLVVGFIVLTALFWCYVIYRVADMLDEYEYKRKWKK